MSTEILLNLAWVLLLSLVGSALPVGVGAIAPLRTGSGRLRVRGRLLLAGLLALVVSLAAGFSLQYGAIYAPQLGGAPRPAWQWTPLGEGSGLLAWAGAGLPGEPDRLVLFLLQAVGAVTVVVLALAPVAGRLPGPGLAGGTLLIGGILYPLLGHWVWGGGWLAAAGRTAYLGHGYADYGGAGVYYALGGLLALSGLLATRARLPDSVESGPPLGGALTILLGTTALNLAGAWGVFPRMGLVAVNTVAGAAAGALTAALYMAFTTTMVRPAMLSRGLLAGAVASAGLAPFAPPTTLLLVGGVGGLLACLGSYLLERVWRLDDAAGIVPTFGLGGMWGMLAVGLFADGTFGQGLNGVTAGRYLGVAGQGVGGIVLLAPGMTPDFGQLTAQLLGLVVVMAWALGPGWLIFRLGSIQPREQQAVGESAAPGEGAPG